MITSHLRANWRQRRRKTTALTAARTQTEKLDMELQRVRRGQMRQTWPMLAPQLHEAKCRRVGDAGLINRFASRA